MRKKTRNGRSPVDKLVNNRVQHHYTDFAHVSESDLTELTANRRKHQSEFYFPLRLYDMLTASEDEGLEDIVSWQPHGRCFLIRNQERFAEVILPKWFTCSKFTSFQRQLSLYDFKRLTTGRDRGAYYHEAFLRGKRFLANRIPRMKIKGTKCRQASSPETEPNFYHRDLPKLPPSNKTESEKEEIPQEKNQTNSSLLSSAAHSNVPEIDKKNEASQQQQEVHGNLSLLSKAAKSRLSEPHVPIIKKKESALKPPKSHRHLASRAVRFRIPSEITTKTSKTLQQASPTVSQRVPAPPAATVSPIDDDRARMSHGFLPSAVAAARSSRQRSFLAPPTNIGPSSNNNNNNNGPIPPPGAVFPPHQLPPVQPTSYSFPMVQPLQQQPQQQQQQQQQPQQQPVVVLVLPGALPPGCLNDPLRAAAAVASLLRGGGGG